VWSPGRMEGDMVNFGWIKAITRPQDYLQEQLKDRRNAADFRPGIRALLWFEAITLGLAVLVVWGSLILVLAVAQVLPIHLGIFGYMLMGVWAAHLGPVSWIAWFLASVLEVGLSPASFSWFVDKSFELAFQAKERRQAQVFNLTALCTLPLLVWALVPMVMSPLIAFVELNGGLLGRLLGPLLGAAGALVVAAVYLIAIFRLVKAIYKQDAIRVAMAIIVSSVCAGIVVFILMLVFNAAASMLPSWDPTRAWTQVLVSRASQGPSGASDLSAALDRAAQQGRALPTVLPSPAPLPTAMPTAVTSMAPAPAHPSKPKSAAKSAPARKPTPVVQAAEPTAQLAPTSVPTSGSGASQAMRDAAAGVDKAAAAKKLLNFFGH
jgi:hypothetical protein